MNLALALDVELDEVVAFVGGGGKTTAMFRLAGEMVEMGERVITTTTTHIFAGQIALAPTYVAAAEATQATVSAALADHGHVLVIGETDARSGRAGGISPELFGRLRAWNPGVCILNEADGSRKLPFKAPAAHEPVIPAETTMVVAVVGADVFGKPLDDANVHRPERVSALTGAAAGTPITPRIVADVLVHPEGGRKGAPAGARFVVLINKVDHLADQTPIKETTECLLGEKAVDRIVLANVSDDEPVRDVWVRLAR
jgi:molybdenum cofactor cytidylyltransferase